jgi:hypothetical protein
MRFGMTALLLCWGCVGDEARLSAGGTGGAMSCPDGQSACAGACVSTDSDRDHCGGCGQACDAAELCSLGQCGSECQGATLQCGDECVDTSNDVDHCGDCDVVCAHPAYGQGVCSGGTCGIACDDDALVEDSGASCLGCAAATVMDAGPLAYWRLGEALGPSAIDASGNGLHGSYLSVGLAAPGVASDGDSAAVFGSPADSRVVRAPFDAFPADAITVEMWLRSSDATTNGTMLSYASAASANDFLIYNYKDLRIDRGPAIVNTGLALNDGQWHHLVVSWEGAGGALTIYVDGVVAFSEVFAVGEALTPGGALVLGQEQDCVDGCFEADQRFIGELDEVIVFDRVLDPAEVALHGRTVTCTP